MSKKPKYLIFLTNEEKFAVKIEDIIAIEKLEYEKGSTFDKRIKRVSSYPDYIEGIFSYKGDVMPIVDFEKVNSGKTTLCHDENKLILLKGEETNYGLLVYDVSTIVEFNEANFRQILTDYPIYTIEKDGEIYSIPDIKKLVDIKKIATAFEEIKANRH